MTNLLLPSIKPLTIKPPVTEDKGVLAWAKELEQSINMVLVKSLEDNRQRIEMGLKNGLLDFTFDNLYVTDTLYLADGTAAAPSLAFTADTNTGLYRPSGDVLGFVCGGNIKGGINTTGIFSGSNGPGNAFIHHSGAVGTPHYSFVDDPDTGIYRAAANQIGFVCGGADKGGVSASGIYSGGGGANSAFIHHSGAVGTPHYSFGDDLDTGLYRIGANNIGIATNGTKRLDISDTKLDLGAYEIEGSNFDVNGGAIDGTPIGAASASTGAFTTLALSSNLTYSGNPFLILANTSDASDTKGCSIGGGGAASITRGATIDLYGNEHATYPGVLHLYAGNVAGGDVIISAATGETILLNNAVQLGVGQISFPASQTQSADVNTLDDYEEGTWTPTVNRSDGGWAGTYSVQTGVYTKIGRLVHAYCKITIATITTHSTGVNIVNVPFAPKTSMDGGAVTQDSALSTDATAVQVYSTSSSYFKFVDTNGVDINENWAAGTIEFTITYLAAT